MMEQVLEFLKYHRELVSNLLTAIIGFIPKLISAAFILVVFFAIYLLLRRLLNGVVHRAEFDEPLVKLLGTVTKVIVLGFGLIIATEQIGVNVMSMLAGLGVAGIAIGLAARETVANFIAGITILWEKPFRIGDFIEVRDTFGRVMEMTLVVTRLKTHDNEIVSIPNTDLVNQKVVNHTMKGKLRLRIPIGIAFKEDIDAAREALMAVIDGDERIAEDPAPQVVVTEVASSSVNLELRPWIKNPWEEVPVREELIEKAKKALDRAGIQIPFPHLQLFIDEAKGLAELLRRMGHESAGSAKPRQDVEGAPRKD